MCQRVQFPADQLLSFYYSSAPPTWMIDSPQLQVNDSQAPLTLTKDHQRKYIFPIQFKLHSVELVPHNSSDNTPPLILEKKKLTTNSLQSVLKEFKSQFQFYDSKKDPRTNSTSQCSQIQSKPLNLQDFSNGWGISIPRPISPVQFSEILRENTYNQNRSVKKQIEIKKFPSPFGSIPLPTQIITGN